MSITLPRSVITQRRRIAHLLDLYERNFHMIERLVPELELPFESAVSRAPDDPPLHLTVVERARYTCELHLTYVFDQDGERRLEPDFWVRIYQDAKVAETLQCGRRMPWLAGAGEERLVEEFLSDQWGRNLMLYKWLEYLLDKGHGFSMAKRPREECRRLSR